MTTESRLLDAALRLLKTNGCDPEQVLGVADFMTEVEDLVDELYATLEEKTARPEKPELSGRWHHAERGKKRTR